MVYYKGGKQYSKIAQCPFDLMDFIELDEITTSEFGSGWSSLSQHSENKKAIKMTKSLTFPQILGFLEIFFYKVEIIGIKNKKKNKKKKKGKGKGK